MYFQKHLQTVSQYWNSSHFLAALLISLLAHGFVLYVFSQRPVKLPLNLSLPSLAVTVVSYRPDEHTNAVPDVPPEPTHEVERPRAKDIKTVQKHIVPVPVKTRAPRQRKALTRTKATKPPIPKSSPPKPTASVAATLSPNPTDTLGREQIESELKLHLAKYFSYPLLARKRGWQGTVLLAFTVLRGKAISNINVLKSSGYEVLDQAAVVALSKVEVNRNGPASPIELQLPVEFRLH